MNALVVTQSDIVALSEKAKTGGGCLEADYDDKYCKADNEDRLGLIQCTAAKLHHVKMPPFGKFTARVVLSNGDGLNPFVCMQLTGLQLHFNEK